MLTRVTVAPARMLAGAGIVVALAGLSGLAGSRPPAHAGVVGQSTARAHLPYATIALDDRSTVVGDRELMHQMRRLPLTRALSFHYRAHDGRRHVLVVLVPRRSHGLLPLVISPHGRGGDAVHACADWGDLPGYAEVAVACADDPGRVELHYSWGDPGEIADLARLPGIVARLLPRRLAPDRVYAVGTSMGAQEVLLLVAHAPWLLRGAVAMDPTTDLARRYGELAFARNGPRDWQPLMRAEVGGTPAQVPRAYAARSPVRATRAIASSGVPLEVWWSRRDRAVPMRPGNQGQRFLQRMAHLHPLAPVCERVGSWPHDSPWRRDLWAVLRFFGLMHGPAVALQAPGRTSYVAGPRTLRAIGACQA
jgi:hypothetical protein